MSIDYSVSLCVGVTVAYDDFCEVFRNKERREPTTHMEDRWDPKTGKKFKPVLVHDDDEKYDNNLDDEFVFNGSTYSDNPDEGQSIYDAIASHLDCVVETDEGSSDPTTVYFSVYGFDVLSGEDDVDCGRVTVGESLNYSVVSSTKMQNKIKMLIKKMKTIGLKPSRPKIIPILVVS